jgi:hypothetical protein
MHGLVGTLLLGLGTFAYSVYQEFRIQLLVAKLRDGTPEEKMQAGWCLKTTLLLPTWVFTATDYPAKCGGIEALIDVLWDGTPAGEQAVQTLLRVSLAEYQVILKSAEAGKIAEVSRMSAAMIALLTDGSPGGAQVAIAIDAEKVRFVVKTVWEADAANRVS